MVLNTALKSLFAQQSVVTETRLEDSVRYPITPPTLHWPESVVSDSPNTSELPTPDSDMVTQPVTITTVTNASVYLTGGRHVVRTNDGNLISIHRVDSTRLADIPWRTHQHLSGTSLVLGNSAGASCYYHWMLDLLPKLGYLESAGIDLNSIDYFLVRHAATAFQIESLKKCGIDRSRIVETAENPYLTCDVAMLLELTHHVNMSMHRFVPEWVNARFGSTQTTVENATEQDAVTRIKLYIKRPAGVRRGIQNADELESLLLSHGFEITAMEGLSIEQQAQLLARADVVVSAHGAALTNLVFAKPGTRVIELFGTHVYPYYFGLANLCKLDYHAILQSSDDYASLVQLDAALLKGSTQNQSITQNEAYRVDLGAVERAISSESQP